PRCTSKRRKSRSSKVLAPGLLTPQTICCVRRAISLRAAIISVGTYPPICSDCASILLLRCFLFSSCLWRREKKLFYSPLQHLIPHPHTFQQIYLCFIIWENYSQTRHKKAYNITNVSQTTAQLTKSARKYVSLGYRAGVVVSLEVNNNQYFGTRRTKVTRFGKREHREAGRHEAW